MFLWQGRPSIEWRSHGVLLRRPDILLLQTRDKFVFRPSVRSTKIWLPVDYNAQWLVEPTESSRIFLNLANDPFLIFPRILGARIWLLSLSQLLNDCCLRRLEDRPAALRQHKANRIAHPPTHFALLRRTNRALLRQTIRPSAGKHSVNGSLVHNLPKIQQKFNP